MRRHLARVFSQKEKKPLGDWVGSCFRFSTSEFRIAIFEFRFSIFDFRLSTPRLCRRGTEAVITGAPRKRLACQKRARGFESHPLRHPQLVANKQLIRGWRRHCPLCRRPASQKASPASRALHRQQAHTYKSMCAPPPRERDAPTTAGETPRRVGAGWPRHIAGVDVALLRSLQWDSRQSSKGARSNGVWRTVA